MTRALAIVLSAALALPACAPRVRPLMSVAPASGAQTPASPATTMEAWRSFLEKLPPGARVRVTLKTGRSVRATLMQVTDTTLVVNPRTRVPEPVQTIALADLAGVDVENEATSVGKAVGIGIAAGVGTFFTILLILISALD